MSEDFTKYLEDIQFQKRLDKLSKKLKDKTIILYGAGLFFQSIHENYDLSGLNIIALSDKKFTEHAENEEFLGYKVCAPEEIKELNPDYVLVGTINFVNLIDNLEENLFAKTKIKVYPLIKKTFEELWKEIWG